MTDQYRERHPFIYALTEMISDLLKAYPHMTLKDFESYLNELILADELENVKRAENLQLKQIFQRYNDSHDNKGHF